MTGITITEALAEIKTVGKRIAKKRDGVGPYLARADGIRDPLEKQGGSGQFVERELQAVSDLEKRLIQLRRAISHANDTTNIAVNGVERTISEWLTWRRDVAPGQRDFLNKLRVTMTQIREDAKRKGVTMAVGTVSRSQDLKPNDIVVNIDEAKIAKDMDWLEDTLGQLDGQLSLKNATVTLQGYMLDDVPAAAPGS